MSLPGFKNTEAEPDLQLLGEVLVKHYLYLRTRPEKADFLSEVVERFYVAPATKFSDELTNFKQVITGNATFYNDALLLVTAVVSELIVPEAYFKKLLKEYEAIRLGMPSNETLSLRLSATDYFACVFFALRFYIDQADLFTEIPEAANTEKEDEKS